MASTTTPTIEGPLFAHPRGPTSVTYSPDGKYLYTAGSNNIIRKFTVASSDEPAQLEISDENTGLAASNTHVFACSEDCTVSACSAATNALTKMLLRTSLPQRALALSPDAAWLAVASDETVVKVVNVESPTQTLTLREQTNSNKHVAFDPSGSLLAVSCTDGVVYVYSLSSELPALVHKLDGVIPRLDSAAESSAKVAWCPDGRGFAVPTATRDIVVIDRQKWGRNRSFGGGHMADITDLAWSPNGAFLASAGKDGKILIWESNGQTIVKRYSYTNVVSLAWHPSENVLSFTTNDGKLYTLNEAVPAEMAAGLRLSVRPAPLIEDAATAAAAAAATRTEVSSDRRRPRAPSPGGNPLDIFGPLSDDEDFVVDDDGHGYASRSPSKRKRSFTTANPFSKRTAFTPWAPTLHESFQPASTPWRGSRRYLCLNMVGFIWTVDQSTHHTVTLEFHDRESFRPVHFTDPDRFDKACLTDVGALFSAPPTDTTPAVLQFRPHESWTARAEWRTYLPAGESVVSLALSSRYIVAATSAGYIRVYTLHGVPVRITRAKHTPIVACASWRDYTLTLANGAVGPSGRAQLTYTITNEARDEVLQDRDVVALPDDAECTGVFWSDAGDPVVYGSDGVLLVLVGWRERGGARWAPLLDTKTLDRLVGGGKEERYWPVAVAQDRFHCIILKGGDTQPYFPRPLLSEFDFKLPLSNAPTSPPATPTAATNPAAATPDALEELYLRESLLLGLQADSAAHRVVTAEEGAQMAARETAIDRALVQLLMGACKDEKAGAKALEICGLFRMKRSLELAVKVALRYGQGVLAERIVQLRDEMEVDGEEEE
ncbi:WD40-repeat-containing domain protein [Geopyxis carbonaria]|nr:WD40-repeat-containing domain protein [Geopyxis carbonaria]